MSMKSFRLPASWIFLPALQTSRHMELSKAGGLLKTGEGGETRESESIRKENRFKELREALFSGLIAGDAAPREIRSLTAESIAFRKQSRQNDIRTQAKEAMGAYEYTLSVRDVQLSETDAFVEYLESPKFLTRHLGCELRRFS